MSKVVERGEGEGYPSTHWSRIVQASLPEQQAGEGALNQLLARYYTPLRAHLEFKFHLAREAAEDLLQGFVVQKVLVRNLLGRSDRARGRFRTFLLNALDNFVKDELRARDCARRRPDGGWVAFEDAPEIPVEGMGGHGGDPFDRTWAMTVLAEAEEETRRFYEAKRRRDTWGVFRDAVLAPVQDGGKRPSDEELAERYGFATARQASNAILTAKRQFGKVLREVVARYAENPTEVDVELRELRAVLARPG